MNGAELSRTISLTFRAGFLLASSLADTTKGVGRSLDGPAIDGECILDEPGTVELKEFWWSVWCGEPTAWRWCM